MKTRIITLAFLFSCSFIMAQTEFDALKYVQTDINGTARYMSMAGAFGALGGDASAIKDNPAGLGIYRRSELTGTMNMLLQNTTTNWKYNSGSKLKDSYGYGDLYKLGANNFTFVLASPTWRNDNGGEGLLSSNWSFSYNRLKNFNRDLYMTSGSSMSSMSDYMAYFSEGFNSNDLSYSSNIGDLFNNQPTLSVYGYQGYLMDSIGDRTWGSSIYNNHITPTYKFSEKGYLNEYSIGWAGNFSNSFFLGATLNFESLNYTGMRNYGETFGSEGSMSIGDTIYTKGTGLNLKIGAIYCPIDFLRLGLSLHTPTIFSITDNYYSTLMYDRTRLASGTLAAPGYYNYYQLQSPLQINLSAAFIIGNNGLLSAEYDFNNYTKTRLLSQNGDSQTYTYENQGMNEMLNNARTIKLGGEYKVTDNFSLRAGYANTNNSTKPTAEKLLESNTKSVDTEYFINKNTNYLTAGFGYREAGWFIDFAYINKIVDETFYPYRSSVLKYQVNPVSVMTSNNNIAVTLGFKF